MANIIQIKRRTSGSAGAPGSLAAGELAFNEVDNKLYYGSNSGVIAIAGDGFYTTVNTSQVLSGSKTFSSSVVLSSAVAETKATATSATSVATTEFVQNVFSLLDGGDFDEAGGGGNNGGGGGGGRLNVPNDVTLVFSPQPTNGTMAYESTEGWSDLTSWFDVSGQPLSTLPTNTDVIFISGDAYYIEPNPLVIDPYQYSLGAKIYIPDISNSYQNEYAISLSASNATNVPLSIFVGEALLTLTNVTLI